MSVLTASAADTPKIPELKVTKLAKAAPKIDGILDDEAWKDAAGSDKFTQSEGEPAKGKCRFKVTYDDNNLYIGVECFEKPEDLKTLKAEVTEHDGSDIWQDDDVEIFIDPTGKNAKPYYQFIFNSKGVSWDAFTPEEDEQDPSWDPKYEVKAHVGKESWTLELAIPLAAFDHTDKSKDTWSFNVLHERYSGDGEHLYWSAVMTESAHTPERFGKLTGMPVRALKTK